MPNVHSNTDEAMARIPILKRCRAELGNKVDGIVFGWMDWTESAPLRKRNIKNGTS